MAKISKEVAANEFQKWLEFKKVRESRRNNNKDQEELIVNTIAEGDLVVNEDYTITFMLSEPIKSDDGDVMVDKLIFKPRIRKADLNKKYAGIKPTDVDSRLLATIAGLTDKNRGLIGKMDTEDISICEAIAVYFL